LAPDFSIFYETNFEIGKQNTVYSVTLA